MLVPYLEEPWEIHTEQRIVSHDKCERLCIIVFEMDI